MTANMLTDDQLKRELLTMDIQLRRKQVAWETPRNIMLIVGAAVALGGLVFGTLGYKIGREPGQPPIIIQLPAQK